MQIVKARSRAEISASFSDAFPHHKNAGIARHLPGQCFDRRLSKRDLSRLTDSGHGLAKFRGRLTKR